MSLGPVNNNVSTQQTQQARAVAPTPKADESRATDAQQPTNTPTDAQRATPDAATQDAARQLQQGAEGPIKNKIQDSLEGGWQEAGNRRTRTTTGRRRVAQGTPTRGLGGDGGSEMA